MSKVLIVGGGVFGTTHAYFSLLAGHEVTLIERDAFPTSASVRNFGMVAVGGRAAGEELHVALRARELWGQIADEHSELTFRPTGSIVVATKQNHLEVMSEVAKYPDAQLRGWELLDRKAALELNPGLKGKNVQGGLYCSQDAVVEPNSLLTELRQVMSRMSGFTFIGETEITEVSETSSGVELKSRDGKTIEGDSAFVVPGADHTTLFPDVFKTAPLRRVFLQMARLESPGFELTTSIANFDSLRFYPGYRGAAIEKLEPVRPLIAEMVMQLLLQQRIDGTLTMGDTHVYQEPFPHEMREDCYDLLLDEVESIIGVRPKVQTRWQGIYSQNTADLICVRERIGNRVMLISGPGGRGNTLAPAIAEQSIKEMFNV